MKAFHYGIMRGQMLTTCQRFISQDIKYGHMQFVSVVGADGGDDVVLY